MATAADTVRVNLLDHGFLTPGCDHHDQIEHARGYYCHFHGLAPSIDDAGLLRHLQSPRICGRADVMHSDTLQKWPAPEISYAIDPAATFGQVSLADATAAIAKAWSLWSQACGIKPVQVPLDWNGPKADIKVWTGDIDGQWGTLAFTEMPDNIPGPAFGGPQRQQKFDSSEAWAVGGGVTRFNLDLLRVALHEVGHAIGIPHLPTGNVMQPTYSLMAPVLRPQDVAEAVARYGAPAPGAVTRMEQGKPMGLHEPVLTLLAAMVSSKPDATAAERDGMLKEAKRLAKQYHEG